MPTVNYYIGVPDGWVEVAPANDFVRVSGYPHTHPYYLYAGASAPSLVAVAAEGDVIFGGVPAAAGTVTIGSETYTFTADTGSTGTVVFSGVPAAGGTVVIGGETFTFTADSTATGAVIFAGLPVADEDIEIGTETYVFKALAAAPFEVTIGADADETGDNLVTAITADGLLVTGVNVAGTVTLTSILPGAIGNYALVDNATNTTVSGATMTGGADAGTDPFDVPVGNDATTTGDSFETVVDTDSTLVTSTNVAGTVTLTSILAGAVSNYTLTETATNTAVSGATMTGGSDAGTDPFEVPVGTDATTTGDSFEAVVNADSTLVLANNAAGTVTVTAVAVGTQGNYALSESATNTTVSGAALTGGEDIPEGVLVCRRPFEVNVTMTEKLFARIPVPVANSNKNNGKLRLDVFTIV